jgi:hypothetical protein
VSYGYFLEALFFLYHVGCCQRVGQVGQEHVALVVRRGPGLYPAFDHLVTYGGLVAYELYVLPGMMLAIMYAAVRNESHSPFGSTCCLTCLHFPWWG